MALRYLSRCPLLAKGAALRPASWVEYRNYYIHLAPLGRYKDKAAISRAYSTSTDMPSSVFPAKKYENADTQKLQILKENKGKAGIYR